MAVNRSNFAIENISNMGSEQIRDDVRKRLIGEAKFLRALAYFNLVRIYGGVPLVLKQTTSLDGLEVPRNTVDECYEQIISDLQEAKSVLPAIGQLPEGYLGRATKGSASAMLAKVYLTREDYGRIMLIILMWKKKMDRNLYLKSSISGILRVCRVVITTDIIVLRLSI